MRADSPFVRRQVRKLARQIVRTRRETRTQARASQAARRSVEIQDGPVSYYDDTGTERLRVGFLADGTFAATESGGDPPPTPTAPNVFPAPGGLRIVYDGTYIDANVPGNFARTEIHAAAAPGYEAVDATQIGAFTSPDGGEFFYATDSLAPVWVALVAVNTADLESAKSQEVEEVAGSIIVGSEPPASSPTPEVFTGNSGAAVVHWNHVEGATHYTLHRVAAPDNLGTLPATPPDATTIHTENAASPMFVYDVPLDADSFFAIQAHWTGDPAQDPAPSPWVIGRAGPIEDRIMDASLAIVQSVISEIVETRGLNIGSGSWTIDEGIQIPNVMGIPSDPALESWMEAEFTANRLTVKNFFTLMGLLNSISQGSELVADSGPTAPGAAPVLKNTWPKLGALGLDALDFGLSAIWQVADNEYVVLEPAKEGWWPAYITRYIDGVQSGASISLGYFTADDIMFTSSVNSGHAGDSGSFIMVGQDIGSTNKDWYIYKCSSSFTGLTKHRLGGSGFFTHRPAVAFYNETVYALVGWKGDGSMTLYTPPINDPGNNGTRFDFTGYSTPFDLVGLSCGAIPGSVDGATWVDDPSSILAWRSNGNALCFPIASPRAYDSSRNVARANGRTVVAASDFVSIDDQGDIWDYDIVNHKGQLAFAWRDTDLGGTGVHETALSPSAEIDPAISRGASVGFVIPAVPDSGDADSPDRAVMFARRVASNPFRLQGIMEATQTEGYLPGGITEAYEVHGTQPTFIGSNLKAGRFRSAKAHPTIAAKYMWDFMGDGSWVLGDMQSEGANGRFEWVKKHTLVPTAGGTYTRNTELVRVGQLVFAFGDVDRPGGGFNAAFHAIAGYNVPVGFRPSSNVLTGYVPNSAATATHRLRYNTDGTVEIQQSALISNFMVTNAMWITEDA